MAKPPAVAHIRQPTSLQATHDHSQLKGKVVANRQEFQEKRLPRVAIGDQKLARPSIISEADQKLLPKTRVNRPRRRKHPMFIR